MCLFGGCSSPVLDPERGYLFCVGRRGYAGRQRNRWKCIMDDLAQCLGMHIPWSSREATCLISSSYFFLKCCVANIDTFRCICISCSCGGRGGFSKCMWEVRCLDLVTETLLKIPVSLHPSPPFLHKSLPPSWLLHRSQ